MMFLNNGPVPASVTCDSACWAKTGLAGGTVVSVRDLWRHVSLGNRSTADFTVELEAEGGVAMFRLSPQ